MNSAWHRFRGAGRHHGRGVRRRRFPADPDGRCVELIDVDAVGLLLADQRGNLRLVASTEESARRLESFQLERDEGPCLECYATGEAIANIDLVAEGSRWPSFAAAAAEIGFSASHALPMRLRRSVIGTLNLFSVERAALSDDQLAVAQALADLATIGLLHERVARDRAVLSEQLQTALHSRVVIEQAKGVLSARAEISVTAAFTHTVLCAAHRTTADHGGSQCGGRLS